MYRHSYRSSIRLRIAPEPAFEYLDDPRRLSAHMTRPSWQLAGSRMQLKADEAGGRAVGSRVTLTGTVLGYALDAELRICERDPPHRKVWETAGVPQLLVIGRYRMGFTLQPGSAEDTRLAIFIEYDPPAHRLGQIVDPLGAWYARWCVRRMLQDAASALSTPINEGAH